MLLHLKIGIIQTIVIPAVSGIGGIVSFDRDDDDEEDDSDSSDNNEADDDFDGDDDDF